MSGYGDHVPPAEALAFAERMLARRCEDLERQILSKGARWPWCKSWNRDHFLKCVTTAETMERLVSKARLAVKRGRW